MSADVEDSEQMPTETTDRVNKDHSLGSAQWYINPLNAKIVAANFSCSAKVVFVKEKRWLCQSTEAPCNALVSVLRLYSKVDRLLTAIT